MNTAGFVNHHSFLLFGGLLLAIWAGVLLVRRGRRGWILWGLALLLLGGGLVGSEHQGRRAAKDRGRYRSFNRFWPTGPGRDLIPTTDWPA